MYSFFYRFLQNVILKRSFNDDIIKIIKKNKIKQIIDIGCADSPLLQKIVGNYFYDGYEVDYSFIKKSKNKYKGKQEYNFFNQGIDEINFEKYDPIDSIIILTGLFHHINDEKIRFFLEKTSNFRIYAIDAVKISDQNMITKLLLSLDKGNYIRNVDHYKKILLNFEFIIARNKYLRFPYDHIISVKNIDHNFVHSIFD